ncbi:MAG: rhodanese-like domain-containing protein [Nodosilinea sp.]
MTSVPDSIPYTSLSAEQLAQRLAASADGLQLIDVREPSEIEIARVEGFVNLPLSQFADWSDTIHSRFEADQETVVMCHHGVRSAQMCMWLAQQGFTQLKNLTGGIEAYAVKVDPSIPRY